MPIVEKEPVQQWRQLLPLVRVRSVGASGAQEQSLPVGQRDIADHEVRFDEEREHVLADVAGLDYRADGAAGDAGRGERARDEELVNRLEVDLELLDCERRLAHPSRDDAGQRSNRSTRRRLGFS